MTNHEKRLVAPASAIGPDEQGAHAQPDRDDHAGVSRDHKCVTFAGLKASAAMNGLELHRLGAREGRVAYLIARQSLTHEVASLDAVAGFLNRWAGRP